MVSRTYYIESPGRLSSHLGQLIVDQKGPDGISIKTSRPLDDAGMILLDHQQILVSMPLLQNCLEKNVLIVVCDQKHLPSGLLIPFSAHSMSGGKMRAQMESPKPLRKKLWQITIAAKIRNQGLVLKSFNLPYKTLMLSSSRVRSGDTSNLEASAAAYYWSHLFGGDKEFKRDRYGPSPNSALNYCYSLLRSEVARSLVGSGLFPFMGIHHKNMYNTLCLADDIMEPFRPFADALIKRLFLNGSINEDEELTKDIKKTCFGLLQSDVNFDQQRKPLQAAIRAVCQRLAHSFETRSSDKLLYPEYE